MGIGIGHFTCLPHKILEVLPAALAGQVLHNEAVFSAHRWPILVPGRAIPAAVAATASPMAAAMSIPPWSTGMLDDHPFTAQLLPIQFIHSIVGIPHVLKLHKAVPIFQVDL